MLPQPSNSQQGIVFGRLYSKYVTHVIITRDGPFGCTHVCIPLTSEAHVHEVGSVIKNIRPAKHGCRLSDSV